MTSFMTKRARLHESSRLERRKNLSGINMSISEIEMNSQEKEEKGEEDIGTYEPNKRKNHTTKQDPIIRN